MNLDKAQDVIADSLAEIDADTHELRAVYYWLNRVRTKTEELVKELGGVVIWSQE